LYLIPWHVSEDRAGSCGIARDRAGTRMNLEDDEDGEDDEDDECRMDESEAPKRIQTSLDTEFEENYKGFAIFEFETDEDEHCITVRSLEG
jgi:hypothetical protein